MHYISTIERMGIEQGLQQGLQRVALRLLQRGESIEEVAEIVGLDRNEIIALTNKSEIITG